MNPFPLSMAQFSNTTSSLPHDLELISAVSRVSGILSLVVWLFAQLPQVLENYANQSVSGVSVAFLVCWISGDATNLLGCLLTRALPFQTCLAAYYCFIDVILSLQFWYYTTVYPRQAVHHNMLQSPNMMRPVKSAGSVKKMLSSRLNRFEASPQKHPYGLSRSSSSERRRRRPRRSFLKSVLSASVISSTFGKASARPVDPESWGKDVSGAGTALVLFLQTLAFQIPKPRFSHALVGTSSGWLSTCFYVCSRTPQIWKNFRSKSTRGVSPFLFLFAMTGNVLYTVSIVSDLYLLSKYDEYLGSADFHAVLSSQMPFLVGSSGTVVFDAVILLQFWLYREKVPALVLDASPSESTKGYSNIHSSLPSAMSPTMPSTMPPSFDIMPSSPKQSRSTSGVHFTKPDWYTNNFQTPAMESGLSFEEFRPDARLVSRPNEHTRLIHDPYIISPPRHYVVSSAQSSVGPHLHTRRKTGLSEAFSAIAKSVTGSPVGRSAMGRSAMGRSLSTASAGMYGPNASLPGTSLLPSLVGTYSSISKKMAHESRIPFSPIDFLHDEFLHPSGSSVDNSRHANGHTRSSSRY